MELLQLQLAVGKCFGVESIHAGTNASSLFKPLRRPAIIRQSAAFGTRKTARADVVIILTYPTMRVFHFYSFKTIVADFVARAEEGMLQGLLCCETSFRVVFEKAG